MDHRITDILESLLRNIDTLNKEVARLSRCDQFTPTTHSRQMVEQIREICMCSLRNVRTIERRFTRKPPVG